MASRNAVTHGLSASRHKTLDEDVLALVAGRLEHEHVAFEANTLAMAIMDLARIEQLRGDILAKSTELDRSDVLKRLERLQRYEQRARGAFRTVAGLRDEQAFTLDHRREEEQ